MVRCWDNPTSISGTLDSETIDFAVEIGWFQSQEIICVFPSGIVDVKALFRLIFLDDICSEVSRCEAGRMYSFSLLGRVCRI